EPRVGSKNAQSRDVTGNRHEADGVIGPRRQEKRLAGLDGHTHRRQPGERWMEQLLLELLTRLEAVGDRDESLFDTEVRARIGFTVFLGFIKPKPGYVLPDDYGMSDEDNREIKAALAAYIEGARALAPALGLDSFHKRLAAFQNDEVHTEQGNKYDEFY